MTIRQVQSSSEKSESLTIEIKTQKTFVGSNSYAPPITVTNNSDSPVKIVSIELYCRGGTYSARQNESYPKELEPGKTENFGAFFDLPEGGQLLVSRATR